MNSRTWRIGAFFLAAAAVTSCGDESSGGGPDGSSAGPTAPTFTSAGSVSVVENTADGFYVPSASDPQNDPITISLYSGADADEFVYDASAGLRFNTPPNFDLPADANGDNVYEVTLRATANGESVDLALRVTVTNDREGISVTRVASGLVDPVGMAFIASNSTFAIAEREGRVMVFNPAAGTLTEDIYIRDRKAPGQNLAISWGFRDSLFQEGTYLVTHDPASGLYVQAFNGVRNFSGSARLGDPWSAPAQASMIQSGSIFIAVGDPAGDRAQDTTSPYGKLFELPIVDPYAGASVPSPILIRPQVIGDGIQKPGGFSPEFGRLYLADQGSTTKNEISIFQASARPLDFGWPFYEGSIAIRSNPPAQVNGPTIEYGFGTERKQGLGVIAGLVNDYNFFQALGYVYVFGDTNGSIYTIPYDKITSGLLRNENDIEDRSLDFAPDMGQIDSPVAILQGDASDRFYILDSDGEIFLVTGA